MPNSSNENNEEVKKLVNDNQTLFIKLASNETLSQEQEELKNSLQCVVDLKKLAEILSVTPTFNPFTGDYDQDTGPLTEFIENNQDFQRYLINNKTSIISCADMKFPRFSRQ